MRWLFSRKSQTLAGREPLPHGLEFRRKELPFDEIHDQWEVVRSRLATDEPRTAAGRSAGLYRYAAVLAAFALLGLLGWWYYGSNQYAHYRTDFGQVASIRLPDQSEVTLNANSALRYRKDWISGQTREVWLEGEAFFRVRRQPQKTRFLVHSGALRVEVLGTAFNVVTRRGETRVVLQSGSVKLLEADQPEKLILMKPNDLVEFKEDRQFRRQVVQPQQYLAWQRRKMVFDDMPMREVAMMLADTHGLEVTFADEALADRKLTGEISTQDIDLLLSAIGALLDAEVQREGQRVLLKNAAAQQP